MKVDVLNQKGKKVEEVELNPLVFEAKINPPLMAQYVRVYLANQRQGTHSTKARGEVRGGGRKPWRQKGTGRARHGSIRSPIWRKGGIAHGPKPRDYSLKMPKKMRRKALFSALSSKVKEGELVIIDKIDLPEIKTKIMLDILKKLPLKGRTLMVLPQKDDKIYFSTRNLSKKEVVVADLLNTYKVLNCETLLLLKEAIKRIEEVFLGKKETQRKTEIAEGTEITELGLPSRVEKILAQAKIKIVDELKKLSDEEILAIKGMGPKGVEEIRKVINQNQK